jgi:1-deoxy-D-xylulose-5-phosphate synthase
VGHGHQAYVHKIVTGRQSGFQQLRRQEGSRVPEPGGERARPDREQPRVHQLSYAYGLAVARDAGRNDFEHIVR